MTKVQDFPKEHKAWRMMRYRIKNPQCKGYQHYGGRGIKICERWDKFDAFLKDMGASPKGSSLDRIDNNGDYSPINCRWATPEQQGQSRVVSNSYLERIRVSFVDTDFQSKSITLYGLKSSDVLPKFCEWADAQFPGSRDKRSGFKKPSDALLGGAK